MFEREKRNDTGLSRLVSYTSASFGEADGDSFLSSRKKAWSFRRRVQGNTQRTTNVWCASAHAGRCLWPCAIVCVKQTGNTKTPSRRSFRRFESRKPKTETRGASATTGPDHGQTDSRENGTFWGDRSRRAAKQKNRRSAKPCSNRTYRKQTGARMSTCRLQPVRLLFCRDGHGHAACWKLCIARFQLI